MKTFEYTIKDELGIHARPAGLLVKEAKKFESECTITKDGKTKKLTQLMMLMSLAACQKAPAQEPAQEETQVQEPVQEEPAQEEAPAQEEGPVQEEEPAQDEDFGIFTEIAGENGTTYANLFDVILDESCDEIWLQMPHRTEDDPRNIVLNQMTKPYRPCEEGRAERPMY